MNLNLLDTNVVLDVVYQERDHHQDSDKFYRTFNYFELSICSRVYEECNRVIINYTTRFGSDLLAYIESKQRRKKHWDAKDRSERKGVLLGFLSDMAIRYKNDSNGYLPFYKAILDRSRTNIQKMQFSELKEFLLEIPRIMLLYLQGEIKARFKVINQFVDIQQSDTFEFTDKLKNVFSNPYFAHRQSEDRRILVNMIGIIVFGDTENNKYSDVTFHTCDQPFTESFANITQLPPKLKNAKYDSYLSIALRALNFSRPY